MIKLKLGNMRASKTILVAGLLFLLSCNNKSIQVSPINTANLKQNGIIYALPRTVICLKINVTRTLTTPGPYAQFAQKYLGITGVPFQKSEECAIESISIGSSVETDPTAMYSAFIAKKKVADFFEIVNSGLILPVGNYNALLATHNSLPKKNNSTVDFFDLSVNPFIAEEKSTFYSKVQRDSSFVRVPIQKNMIIEKNAEEKAKEAADLIFSLRKKRLEFITVDVDHQLDGDALKTMFAEVNRLENDYLSLFIGKTSSETISKCVLYTPTKPEGESSIAFRFSLTKGIVAANDMSGTPILIEIEPELMPDTYSAFFNKVTETANKNGFNQVYYRIPNNAIVRLSDGKNELASSRLPIYQYGLTAKLPVEHL